jgi:Holliday junction resolvase RusA-like endonuclease
MVSGRRPRRGVASPTRSITIIGTPVGKPRQTQRDRWKLRPAVVRYRAWADHARATVWRELGRDALTEVPLQVIVMAWLPRPKRPRPGQELGAPHRQKPDADNVLKAVCDALWPGHDERIAAGSIGKAWDDGQGPRLEVRWWP